MSSVRIAILTIIFVMAAAGADAVDIGPLVTQ